MNVKIQLFVICVDMTVYLLLANLHDGTSHEGAEAATSSYFAAGGFYQCIYSVFVAKNHRSSNQGV